MLQEFLKSLGAATGKTYTPEEFAKIIKAALASAAAAKAGGGSEQDNQKKTKGK